MKRQVTEYALYKYRYIIGYGTAIIASIAVLTFAALYVPGGIRAAEQHSTILSGSLEFTEFNPEAVVDLPYHVLQRASFAVFGISELSIKLASIIFGVLAVSGMFLLVTEWFRRNVAVITVLITATIPAFIFTAQDGTPYIFAITVAIWLLYTATKITRNKEPLLLWKLLFFVLFVLNLYSPLGIYLNIAVASTVLFHPHIRYLARRVNLNRVFVAAAVALVVMSPLLYSITTNPQIGLTLLGVPQQMPDLLANAKQLLATYTGLGSSSELIRPVFSFGVLVIMAIGFYRFILVKYTARSYIIWLWGILLVPLLLLNPSYAIYLLPLAMLMIAMGINTLIAEWYKLFPHNPYARVFGLLPLSIIVVGIVASGIARYGAHYYYAPLTVREFTNDVSLLKQTLDRSEVTTDAPLVVVVSKDTLAFYQLFANYDRRFTATTDSKNVPLPFIVSREAPQLPQIREIPAYIAVDRMSEGADRFYLYKSSR